MDMTTATGATAQNTGYQFGHEWELERDRLASIEEFNDPGTIRHLEAIGVGDGWQCLEVGAGAGSIAAWLSLRVGDDGRVVATELDTRFLDALPARHNLEVRRHDITVDELPEGSFDLIHERAVLLHLPSRREILERLVNALRPGGWLVCEDTDFAPFVHGSPIEPLQRAAAAMVQFLRSTGAEPDYGRHLHHDLSALGVHNIGAEGRVYVMRGAHRSSILPRYTLERVRGGAVALGVATDADFDQAIAAFDDPQFSATSHLMMAAWGQRPA